MGKVVTKENARELGEFGQFKKIQNTTISLFTMPSGTAYETPEGLKAEDEETRIAFDIQGRVYPIRESVFQKTYEAIEENEITRSWLENFGPNPTRWE